MILSSRFSGRDCGAGSWRHLEAPALKVGATELIELKAAPLLSGSNRLLLPTQISGAKV